jgi:predicted AlkP superfamily phosphohydrolase/phosphomutase
MGRVAAIAVDAGEWWYLERLLAEGRMPNLARLRDRSARWDLRSPLAYRSELVWARFLTGREPIDTKDWAVSITFDPDTYDIGLNTASTERPFFAFGPGTEVVALDLIHSSTAEDVEGAQVVAWGSHSPQWPRASRPVGLLTEIDERFGTNPAFGNDFDYGWHDPAFIDALTEACRVGGDRRVDIARWLLDEHPDWQLFLTCFAEMHSLGHHLWHGVDDRHPLHGTAPTSELAGRRMDEGLADLDAALGRLLDGFDDDTAVLLFAMHGFQPADDLVSTVLLPELLQRHHLGRRAGLLRDPDQAAWRAAGCPPVVPPPDRRIGEVLVDRFADNPRQRVRRALRGALPDAAFERVRRALGGAPLTPLAAMDRPTPPEVRELTPEAIDAVRKPPTYEVAYWYRRHWPRMPWFALPSFADGHIRVNLRGREASGLVAKEDYAATLDEIEAFLGACRDARTGAPILADVLRLREADPMDPEGPDADLLVIFEGAPDAVEHPTVGTVGPFPHLRTAHHSPDGFALLAAPGVAPGDRGSRPSEDLTPTVLRLLGKDVPAGMRGRPLHEAG